MGPVSCMEIRGRRIQIIGVALLCSLWTGHRWCVPSFTGLDIRTHVHIFEGSQVECSYVVYLLYSFWKQAIIPYKNDSHISFHMH